MSYQPFALKYRPQRFRDLVGQEHVATTLKNAIRDERVANAFLFTGSRGVGKTSSARILAKALNCPTPVDGEPCCVCDVCAAIAVGEDLDVLEIDGASNRGIDEIRRIRDNVSFRPARSRYKIFIIDEVHMLTTQAFNALLKTLEEPPSHVKFIFATTEFAQVPETIVSRCQRFDFRRITPDDLVDRLKFVAAEEGLEAEPGAFEEIARKAEGGLRDTMSLLDQTVSFGGAKVTVAAVERALGGVDAERIKGLLSAAGDGDAGATLRALDEAFSAGRDAEELLEQLLEALREALSATARELPAGAGGRRAHVIDAVRARFDLDRLLFGLRLLLNTAREVKLAGRGRMQLEVGLLKLARSSDLVPWKDVLARLERGEGIEAGAAPRRAADAPRAPVSAPAAQAVAPPAAQAATAPPAGGASGEVRRPAWVPPTQRPTPAPPAAAAPAAPRAPFPPAAPPSGPTSSAPGAVAAATTAPPRAAAPAIPPSAAPRPAAAPAPAQHRSGGGSAAVFGLPEAEAAWLKTFRTLQTANPRVAAAVDGGAVTGVLPGEVVVELPAGRAFQKRTLETPETRLVVERLMADALGPGVRLRYELGVGESQAAARAPKKDVYSDPGVRKVLDAFDGGVVHVQGEKTP
jgi:DNA polymerase-3 subunit gamma/tau